MRVFVNAIPKSGTHLLKQIVRLLGFTDHPTCIAYETAIKAPARYNLFFVPIRGIPILVGATTPTKIHKNYLAEIIDKIPDNNVFHGHCIYTPSISSFFKNKNIKIISIIRDPRDIAVSLYHYLQKNSFEDFNNLSTERSKLLFTILGGQLKNMESSRMQTYRPLSSVCDDFFGWTQDQTALTVRFEDLVGSQGGGSNESQLITIRNIGAFLGVPIIDPQPIAISAFGASATFRSGQIGGWKLIEDSEFKTIANKSLSKYLTMTGYAAY